MTDGVAPSTLLFRTIGTLGILAHAAIAPDAEEWTRYVLELASFGKTHENVRLLVVADSAGPSAAQRDELSRHAPRTIVTAVVTTSVFVRSIVSLLRWRNSTIRAFAPANMDGALTHLSVPASERAAVLEQVATMRAQLS